MDYSRQIVFEKIGEEGQKKLKNSTVTIIGLGATGSRSAELLTRSGVGRLILIDRDVIETSNLQRQTLFTSKDINKPKAIAAKFYLEEINPEIKINANFKDLTYKNIESNIKGDLILDCTDNLQTRFLINEFSIENNFPWIYSAVIGNSGMIFNFIPKKTPCFSCIFKEPTSPLDSCDTEGIINTIVSLIASIQVTEALKFLTSQALTKELIYYDIWRNKIQKTKVKSNLNCEICKKHNYKYLTGENFQELVKICGTNSYQIKGQKLKLEEVAKKLQGSILNEYCLIYKELIMFRDGRTLIKADSEEKAKSLYTKYIGN